MNILFIIYQDKIFVQNHILQKMHFDEHIRNFIFLTYNQTYIVTYIYIYRQFQNYFLSTTKYIIQIEMRINGIHDETIMRSLS